MGPMDHLLKRTLTNYYHYHSGFLLNEHDEGLNSTSKIVHRCGLLLLAVGFHMLPFTAGGCVKTRSCDHLLQICCA